MEYRIDPKGIEKESMAIIEGLVPTLPQDPLARAVVKRVIHTTGDPDYVTLVSYSPGGLEAGQKALAGGAKIITDVNLVKAGVTSVYQKKYGGQVYCFLNDPRVVERALTCGQTRAMTAMELALEQLAGGIVAIGNAPTALFKLLELLAENPLKRPALIIGTPVGFVGAKEAKEALAQSSYPFVTVKGNKGGSMVAASIVNALIYSI